MVGSLNSAMTAALLAVRVEVPNFYGRTGAVLPLNLHIGLVHIDHPSQLAAKWLGKTARFLPVHLQRQGYIFVFS